MAVVDISQLGKRTVTRKTVGPRVVDQKGDMKIMDIGEVTETIEVIQPILYVEEAMELGPGIEWKPCVTVIKGVRTPAWETSYKKHSFMLLEGDYEKYLLEQKNRAARTEKATKPAPKGKAPVGEASEDE